MSETEMTRIPSSSAPAQHTVERSPHTTPRETDPTPVPEDSRSLVPSATRGLYDGIAAKSFAPHQTQLLMEPIHEEQLDVLPTGEVYLSQIHYRRCLNKSFGPGGWSFRPIGPAVVRDNAIMREYALFVESRFVAQAVGEADYIPNNPRMTWATASEACRSNALMRLCKDIGIASECWDRRFTEEFKARKCIKVYRTGRHRTPWQWRLKDSYPFEDEGAPPTPSSSPPRIVPPRSPAPDKPAEGRFIQSKYDGKCHGCERPITTGQTVWYQPGQKGVLCKPCTEVPNTEPVSRRCSDGLH